MRIRSGRPATRLIGQVLSALLLGVVITCATTLVVVPRLTGSVPLTVLTGSMSPTYDAGSVVVVKPTPVDKLEIGDAITFQERSGHPAVVTHRIVSIAFAGDGSRQFITQGDANGAADPDPVKEAQVRGKVWYSVPIVGHAATLVAPSYRQIALKVLAGSLVLYGAYLILAETWVRRRRQLAST